MERQGQNGARTEWWSNFHETLLYQDKLRTTEDKVRTLENQVQALADGFVSEKKERKKLQDALVNEKRDKERLQDIVERLEQELKTCKTERARAYCDNNMQSAILQRSLGKLRSGFDDLSQKNATLEAKFRRLDVSQGSNNGL